MSTYGDGGTDGQRPEPETPEKDTSAEELHTEPTPEGGVSDTRKEEPEGLDTAGSEGDESVGESPEPEFIAGPVTFKTSGSFFRERVERNLAEKGFDLEEESETEGEDSDAPAADPSGSPTKAEVEKDAEVVEDDDPEPVRASEPAEKDQEAEENSGDVDPELTVPLRPVEDQAEDDVGEVGEADGVGETVDDPGDVVDSEAKTVDTSSDSSLASEVLAAAAAVSGAEVAADETTEHSADQEPADQEPADQEPADQEPADQESTDQEPEDTSASAEPPRTEPIPGPPPEPVDTDSSTTSSTTEALSAPESTEGQQDKDDSEKTSLWPAPQRFSEYSGDADDQDESESSGEDGPPEVSSSGDSPTDDVAAAAHAASGAQSSESGSETGSGKPGGPSGPGGPKAPPSGPGGPQGPGGKGPKGKKPKKPLWWRITRVCLIVTGLFVIVGCGAFAFLYTTVEMPDAAKADAIDQGSTFYYNDGETVFAERGVNRDPISYEEMVEGGEHVVEAMISAEDRGFWTEPGVSISGTTRAVWSTITGQQVQGGSTITQQMVRNYYEGVSREQTVGRKLQEIIISIKVDQSETKEWVMEQYLNTIYFGRQAYGVQAAAEAYYHKNVDELTPEEAAFLAAAIQQPHYYGEADVETTPEMENRWEYVINGMVTTGAITQSEADEMEFPAPEPERPDMSEDLSGFKGYMLQEAMNELERLDFTEDMIQRHGYEIVTTFDEDMMEAAYETVEETVPVEDLPEDVNLGLTTIDPATGEVLGFYGGHDYVANQYDSAFLGAAQAGSAFKPYVLATALEQGYGLNSRVDGRGPRDIQGSRVQNAGNSPGGVMTLTQATQVSNNLGYIELAQEVGFEEIRQTAYDMGLPEGSIDDNQLVPVMPLGATSVRPVDQASGFGTFANEGVHVDAHVVKEIVTTDGEDVRPEVESNRALDEDTAADATHALQQVVNSGTGRSANLWSHPTAGKTGTTDDSVAAWFVGFTPQLSTAVGVYSGNNEPFSIPGHQISGGGLPATLWNNYMSRVMEDYEPGSFPPPAYGGTTENWAPEPSTEGPEQPQEPEGPPEDTQPEVPEEPEVEIPEIPEDPEDPGFPDDPWTPDPGIPEEPWDPEDDPPGRGDE